jgi:hypothetical protein
MPVSSSLQPAIAVGRLVLSGTCALVVSLLPLSAARACTGGTTVSVVGWSKNGKTAVFRFGLDGEDPGDVDRAIDLRLFDLTSGEYTKTYPIVTESDEPKSRAAIRSRRWKTAEAELIQKGFQFAPRYPIISGAPEINMEWPGRQAQIRSKEQCN